MTKYNDKQRIGNRSSCRFLKMQRIVLARYASLLHIYQKFSTDRAGKSVRPGAALVLDGIPHRVTKMNQGKRGKGKLNLNIKLLFEFISGRWWIHSSNIEKSFKRSNL